MELFDGCPVMCVGGSLDGQDVLYYKDTESVRIRRSGESLAMLDEEYTLVPVAISLSAVVFRGSVFRSEHMVDDDEFVDRVMGLHALRLGRWKTEREELRGFKRRSEQEASNA